MFEAPASPYRIDPGHPVEPSELPTAPPEGTPGKKELKERLAAATERIAELQHILYAHNRHALLIIFQAMDAAGKDSTIRRVMTGVNPAGCQVFSFKRPSNEELDHDFLWRTTCRLPERGRIGIFNRSYYEETLVVRVHPGILEGQRVDVPDLDELWPQRFRSFVELERHLAYNGTAILKFWLNVSREEQRQRFLSRLNEPEKNWKFSSGDVRERGLWPKYMEAYKDTIEATTRPWAPWYAIPADDKRYMRVVVAELIVAALESVDPEYPKVTDEQRATFDEMRAFLETDTD